MTHPDQLAVLCATLDGRDDVRAAMAPSEADYALNRLHKRVLQAIDGNEGDLHDDRDGVFLARFRSDENALLAAIDIQRRLAGLPPMAGISVGVRVGVCIGHAAREAPFFADVAHNPAVILSGCARPGELLLSVPRRAHPLAWSDVAASRRPEIPLCCGRRHLGVFEIDWHSCHGTTLKVAPPPASAHELRLVLSHAGQMQTVDRARPLLSCGRLAANDLPLHHERCSRVHARIELRGNRFVLIDQSTNGSFVTVENDREQHVHGGEIALRGRGRISFTGPYDSTERERFEYRIDNVAAASPP